MCEALDDHEGSVSIGGWLITNFRFADDIVVNAEEEEEAGVLIDRLGRTTTRYKMEIGPDKTKVMTNNPNGFQRETKIKGQRLEEVENFKYLGAIISNEGSKPEILSRTAQTTAALSRLKIIWRDKNISLASKVKLIWMLILSNSVTQVTVSQHEASLCQQGASLVMPNSYPSDGKFDLHHRTIMDSFSCILFLRQLRLELNTCCFINFTLK